ncbi:hypothetical protein BK665_18510 [Pseudomonas frederiksbergensis]|uniref:ATP-binding protein n=2 Tax=Pseudomonas frederiksbergensis TaxID=104087 RepID=A0A423KGN4_9PSED|nr:hypothetical protein BK665_18510 [Pseudomonas frederiksbergensis]
MRDVFLLHPTAMAAEQSAQRLLSLPRSTSNPGMSLIAHPGLGKSSLGQRWQKQSFLPDSQWAGKIIYIDLVKNIANLNITKLFLAEIGIRFYKRPLTLSYWDVALAQSLIREHNVRGVFIDEIPLVEQTLSVKRINREYGAIKGFAGPDWQLNVILSGTADGFGKVFESDNTLSTRFSLRKAMLSEWKADYEGESFVKGYLYYMPLNQPSVVNDKLISNLRDSAMTTVMVNRVSISYCSRRAVVEILRESCRMAVESGQEYINADSILKAWNSMQGMDDALKHLAIRPTPQQDAAPQVR